MNKLSQMVKAAAFGIKIPYQTMKASDDTGVPFYVLCAFLEQESAGGRNIFGHDPTIYRGAGRVTKAKYLAYKRVRDSTNPRKMQGVGPMQLTWWEFQDEADAAGGCWRPVYNVLVGARILARYRAEGRTWQQVATKYNGSVSYGNEVAARITQWQQRLA